MRQLRLIAYGEPSEVVELNTISEPALGQEDVLVTMEAGRSIHQTFYSSVAPTESGQYSHSRWAPRVLVGSPRLERRLTRRYRVSES